MGSMCIFPLSSMESVFHFICGITGSVVCLNCFAWVASVDSLCCTCTLGVVPTKSVSGKPVAVSGADVLILQISIEVVGCMVKVCGHLIFGKSTYPSAFACALPSMISPVMPITSNMVGNALLSTCRCKTHEPRLCTDFPPYASICTLGGSRVLSHS